MIREERGRREGRRKRAGEGERGEGSGIRIMGAFTVRQSRLATLAPTK